MTTVREFAISTGNSGSCSTAGLRPLNQQILSLLLPVVAGDFVPCDDIVTVAGSSTLAFLQPEAKEALRRAAQEKGERPQVIHAYRTIAQQFVLRQWHINGRCHIKSARTPGTSDHERGTAIDIHDNERWRDVLERHDWRWAGPGDEGHFRFIGGGTTDRVLTESVRAFQRLWNQHNPDDPIKEDGVFGDIETGPRLLIAPIGGF